MYAPRYRLLFALLCAILLCSAVQAADLQIYVQDSIDNTTLPHATVFVNGANYAITNNNGQVYLSHGGVNDQVIKVTMSGYDDWQQTVAKNATSLTVNLKRKTLTLKVNLYDSDTLGPVVGALVNITAVNVTQAKLTDASGAATFAVISNNLYSMSIATANYQPRSDNIEVGAENKEVQYWLLPSNRFSVMVKDKEAQSPISGAEVTIDSVLAGKTDARGVLIAPITRGKVHLFEIRAPGYQTVSESRTITESDAIYSVAVSKAAIGAFIYVFDEKKIPLNNANIYFNGSLTGTTNEYGRSNFPSLVAGSYQVEVRKDGYVPQSRTIVVSGQPDDYTFTLALQNAALSVLVQDKEQKALPNSSVTINDAFAGMTNSQGQLITPVTFNTPLNITVSKEGYAPGSVQQKIIQGNATASVNVTLEKNFDWGLLTTIGAGVLIIIVLFGIMRLFSGRRHRHILRRDEI
jgi:hypothetical protein